jgi:AcrR family transcriptional regulator
VANGTFYVHFTDREAFVGALRADFRARVAEQVASAVGGMAPGAERCGRAPLVAQVEATLRDMGLRDAPHAAGLIVAMAPEIALSEHESASKQHGARRWLRRFIERG